MRVIHVVFLIAVIILIGVVYLTARDEVIDNDTGKDLQDMNLGIEFIPEDGLESQEIRVLGEDGSVVFALTIGELNQWTKENWHVFEEKPEVEGREVEPASFAFFDRSASISNNNRKMIFSVSDYAVATTVSFLIVVDINSGKMEMISEPVSGSVEDYFWSKDSSLVAYTVGTGRARGDFLLVDDVVNLERRFMLDEEDILETLDPEKEIEQFMPVFEDLRWSEERLYFTTEHPENDQLRWSIDKEGRELQMEDYEAYISPSLGVFLKHPSGANIDYEEGRIKVTYVGEDSHMTQITDGFVLFVDVVSGEEKSIESVAEEEFKERTQALDYIAEPYEKEINGKRAMVFEVEGGLGGEHIFFIFEEGGKVVVTSYFISDPHNKKYKQKVRDILLSIEVKED